MQKIHTKNRLIFRSVLSSKSQNLINDLKAIEPNSMHTHLPVVWSKAKGSSVYDLYGNKFIDFTSTIFVTNIGHSNSKLVKNLKKALNNELLHSYIYPHELRKNYIKKLIQFSGKKFQKAFLLSSGTEATEAALKLMKLYGIKRKKRKNIIICIEGNWHGRTMGAQLMSNNSKQRKWIGNVDAQIIHIPFPYPWKVKENQGKKFFLNSIKKISKKFNLKKDIAGIMLETFQGWGAVFYPISYVREISKFCKKNDIILSFDEMQAGFGRTGLNFGFEHYKVDPDMICCGKGMGGGIPLSGVLGKKKIMDLPNIGDMSSTNSGNPLSCVAGITVINELAKNNIIRNVKKKEKILLTHLKKIEKKFPKFIKFVSVKGLIAAIIFKNPNSKKNINKINNVCIDCLQNGLIVVNTGRESIKIGPPLSITDSALREGLEVLEQSIGKFFHASN